LSKAEQAGDLRTALGAIREARGNLELLAKLLGELAEQPQISIALIEHPDYQRLEDSIFRALEHYDEARWAVASELKGLES